MGAEGRAQAERRAAGSSPARGSSLLPRLTAPLLLLIQGSKRWELNCRWTNLDGGHSEGFLFLLLMSGLVVLLERWPLPRKKTLREEWGLVELGVFVGQENQDQRFPFTFDVLIKR